MKVEFITPSRLRNDAHFQFHTDFKDFIEEQTPAALNITPLYGSYLQLYAKVDEAFKKIVKSAITKQIQDADKARDEIWKGLTESNTAALKHFDPQVREAARRLQIVFNTYGNIARKSFNEQTSATYNILQELEGQYAQHVAKVGILHWVVELKARNIAFNNLMRDRVDETSLKVATVLRDARAELDKAYYDIVEGINAQASLEALGITEATGKFDAPIRKLNVIIAKYQFLVQSSKKGKKGKPEAEDEQADDGTDE